MNTNSVDFFKDQPVKVMPGASRLIIAVWKLGNPGNMGSVIRLGHNLGAEKVLFVDDEIKKRESRIKKTAGFSFYQQPWEVIGEGQFFPSIPDGYKLVALETCEGSENIYETVLPEKMLLLGGNESHGLPGNVIMQSNLLVHIPMPGDCKSMNISHALSLAGFEWYRQGMIWGKVKG